MNGPVLRVDLDRLAGNLAVVRERIAPSQPMLVVKDDAYGHGLDAVVRRAAAEGVTWYGAFDVATGLRVRELAGGDARVFTWIPASRAALDEAVAAGLDLGVGDETMLATVADLAIERGRSARVHLEVDSGLHRGGTRPEDWGALVTAAVRHADAVEVAGIFSHLAEASDDDDDAAAAVFDAAVAAAEAQGLRPELLHLTASAASFARPQLRRDLCRIGAFAYGIRPDGFPADLGVSPIGRLEASVLAVGDAVVTLQIGAAHGVPSLLGRRLRVRTPDGARRVTHVGDHVSEVESWPSAAIGQTIAVWGADAEATATDAAELVGTIGEELAVRISPRVPRRYA